MSVGTLNRLGDLIQLEHKALLEDWRERVMKLPSASDLDAPTLIDHIPDLLEELADALQSRRDESISEMLVGGTPPRHGLQRLYDGFNLEEVVAEYNMLRGAIHDLAERHGVVVRGQTFHILNRVLDEAIGLAVQTYATERAIEVQERRSEYLAFVAHDLRTPLHAIALSTQVLASALGKSGGRPETAQALAVLERNIGRLNALIKKILDENITEPGTLPEKIVRRQIDLWPIVHAVFHDLEPIAATNSTELANEVPVDLVASADAGMLSRIFQNLVANAMRCTPRGRVTVRARSLGEGDVECLVIDNGKGISPDMLGRVFEMYETGDDRAAGAGLALAIVKELVEAHDGQVYVESEQDVQTTFRFTLPGA